MTSLPATPSLPTEKLLKRCSFPIVPADFFNFNITILATEETNLALSLCVLLCERKVYSTLKVF